MIVSVVGGYPYDPRRDRHPDRPLLHRRAGPHRAAAHPPPARFAEDRVYLDHGLIGTTSVRPGLDHALATVRAGDTLVVPKFDRLARSVPDARDIGDSLAACGIWPSKRLVNDGGN
jgi:hypothetical protein